VVRLGEAGWDGDAQAASVAYDALVVHSKKQSAFSIILLVVFTAVPFDSY
jgi:hypothetical protein